MSFDAPFRLGPFLVDADGGLTPGTPDHFPSLRVRWHDHVVEGRLTTKQPPDGVLLLSTVLGRVPSMGRGESAARVPRQAAFATLGALPGTLPPGWTVGLTADHRVVAAVERPLALPTSAETLVGEFTLFLLGLTPYLDLLAEGVGIEAAGAVGVVGSMNT
jgi:hypothetical protein